MLNDDEPLPPEPEDPFLEAELDRAIAPYRELLPPEMVQHYRDLLGDILTTHPLGRKLLDRARPRPVLQRSTTRTKLPNPSKKAKASGGSDS